MDNIVAKQFAKFSDLFFEKIYLKYQENPDIIELESELRELVEHHAYQTYKDNILTEGLMRAWQDKGMCEPDDVKRLAFYSGKIAVYCEILEAFDLIAKKADKEKQNKIIGGANGTGTNTTTGTENTEEEGRNSEFI